MYPRLPERLGKKTTTKGIDGAPMVYTVVGEEVFLAKSTPNKAFCIHKLHYEDGTDGFRLGYYMIAHKPRMKGKWAWGQFAPMMSKDEMTEIFDKIKAKGWV